jgi:hypothetical protein
MKAQRLFSLCLLLMGCSLVFAQEKVTGKKNAPDATVQPVATPSGKDPKVVVGPASG